MVCLSTIGLCAWTFDPEEVVLFQKAVRDLVGMLDWRITEGGV